MDGETRKDWVVLLAILVIIVIGGIIMGRLGVLP